MDEQVTGLAQSVPLAEPVSQRERISALDARGFAYWASWREHRLVRFTKGSTFLASICTLAN